MRNEDIIFVYDKLMRFPMFPLTKKTKVVQESRRYTITMVSREPVNVETEEKLLAIVKLVQSGVAKTEYLETKSPDKWRSCVVVEVDIKEISKITGTKDYKRIIEEYEKLQFTSFYVENKENKTKLFTSPILSFKYDPKTGLLVFKLEPLFLSLCSVQNLCLNYAHYVKLSKTAKNLFKFLSAHRDSNKFSILTIKQRCHLETTTPKHTREKIRKALYELKSIGFVSDFIVDDLSVYILFK